MENKYKYIYFTEVPTMNKTKQFHCRNIKSDSMLGIIKWYPQWRQYCFFPVVGTIFSKGCLTDIQDFIESIKNVQN